MVCQRWCVKDGVWQSGVKDDVWKMVCDKVVRQRWYVKDGAWKMVCDKAVCQRWCVKDGVWKIYSAWKPAAAQRRPRAQQLLQKDLCTAPESEPRASGGHARSSSSRRLRVLRLPHPRVQQLLQEALCTAPATGQPAAGRRSKCWVLCDESHVWCEMFVMSSCKSHVWWELSAVWWVGVRVSWVLCKELDMRG